MIYSTGSTRTLVSGTGQNDANEGKQRSGAAVENQRCTAAVLDVGRVHIAVLNDSPEPRLRREAAFVLAECKNWTGKCGKDEFVLFRQKIEIRNGRCSLGFLISWNEFDRPPRGGPG